MVKIDSISEYSYISEEDRKELVGFIAYEKDRLDAITT
jgi:hypothetical protein